MEENKGGDIVFHNILCHAVNIIIDSTLQGWMEQPFLHLLFIGFDIGRKSCWTFSFVLGSTVSGIMNSYLIL